MQSQAQVYYPYRTPYGILTICATERGIARIAFGEEAFDGALEPSALTNRAITELLEYFAGKRTAFNVPLDLAGTEYQKAVWSRVCRVPYGTTATAADIARAMGDDGNYRAVGTAVKRNPVPVIVPTHRIVGANGRALAGEAAPKVFSGLRKLEADVASGEHGKLRY